MKINKTLLISVFILVFVILGFLIATKRLPLFKRVAPINNEDRNSTRTIDQEVEDISNILNSVEE